MAAGPDSQSEKQEALQYVMTICLYHQKEERFCFLKVIVPIELHTTVERYY